MRNRSTFFLNKFSNSITLHLRETYGSILNRLSRGALPFWLTAVKAGHMMNLKVKRWTNIPPRDAMWRERIFLNNNSNYYTHTDTVKWSQYSFSVCLSIVFTSLAAIIIARKPAKNEGKKKKIWDFGFWNI